MVAAGDPNLIIRASHLSTIYLRVVSVGGSVVRDWFHGCMCVGKLG